MAVLSDPKASAATPGIGIFLRLKLRVLQNSLRAGSGRTLAFVLGLVGGAFGALFGFTTLLSMASMPVTVGYTMTVTYGSFIVLGWILLPLLVAGTDDTLAPSRFAMLPIRRRSLVSGLLAAAFLGIPAAATLAATSAFVIVGFIRGGVVGAVMALLGTLLGLAFCVVASRAVTSGFAQALRSRKAKDRSAMFGALSVFLIWPILGMSNFFVSAEGGEAWSSVSQYSRWTPFAAPYTAWYDITLGDVWLGVGKLAFTAAATALLLWWWSRSIESAMLDGAKGSTNAKSAKQSSGKVKGMPLSLFGRAPSSPFGAIMAVNVRMHWRDARFRTGLMTNVGMGVFIPYLWGISSGLSLTLIAVWSGIFLVNNLYSNQFGYDGAAYATHLLAGVRARTDLAARTCVSAMLALPLSTAILVSLALLTSQSDRIPVALGVNYAATGIVFGTIAVASVYGAYAMPPASKPFSMENGTGCSKAGPMALICLAELLLIAPFAFLAWWVQDSPWSLLVLPIGMAYGLGVALIGQRIGAKALEKRGPDLLVEITPR